ncbi:hypothetical protein F6Y02_06700 (plasmid) [Bacillus megaterium]|nr:hypothetical protein [Priestia megaterium]
MEINNSNEQIEQSAVAEPRVLTSFVAYCTFVHHIGGLDVMQLKQKLNH